MRNKYIKYYIKEKLTRKYHIKWNKLAKGMWLKWDLNQQPPGYKSSALPSLAIQPYDGLDPFLTNIFAMGASQKPYMNLACLVTEDHTQFSWYNPESDTVGI